MQEKIIPLVTPIFFLLIFIELIAGHLRGRNTIRTNDAINSISLGVLGQISGAFTLFLSIGIYAWLVQHVSLWQLPADSWWVWIVGLLLYDLGYYWLHRKGHEIKVLWAAHIVHHQSEEYNLTTALRQTSSGALLSWIFFVPMALLGFPVEVYTGVALIDLLYQFWVHTQQIDKLGWFDRVFVSPSNHRAHHGVNDIYLDKNYGGILIIWDRLFGTFVEENDNEPVVYGTRGPLRSWNPLWANLEIYKAMWQDSMHTRRWRDKLLVWITSPGWRPADVIDAWPKPEFDINRPLYDPPLSTAAKWYCAIQFTLVILLTTHFLLVYRTLPSAHTVIYALWLVASLWMIGGLLERQPHHVRLEALRLALTAGGVWMSGLWFGGVALSANTQLAAIALAAASLLALWLTFKPATGPHGYISD